MKTEILRLFKGFIGTKTNEVNAEALKYGILIPATASNGVVDEAIKMYGKDGSLWNQTFHKSWDKVANAPMLQLVIEQLMHYFTTYGFEALGCYNEASVYVPAEALEIPELDTEKVKFVVINALTREEVSEKMMTLVTSGIALSDETVKDIMVLSDYIDKERFDEVSNREVRTFLYEKYGVMPRDPEAFLRYLIFKTTGATLKIQNVSTYRALMYGKKDVALTMLKSYYSLDRLSSIFLRNKNLFLALKSTKDTSKEQKELNRIVNKLRKLAEKNHRPLKANILDTLTSNEDVNEEELVAALEKVTLFRAIRILNALSYRINGCEDIVYRVRNGKSYVSTVNTSNKATVSKTYDIVKAYVSKKLAEKVNGKTVYIPEGITYKAPTSEKQFVNNIPEGSFVELPDGVDLTYAIHWNNVADKVQSPYSDNGRVDLDFRTMNANQNFGWNTSYRDVERKVLFSGDLTDAPAPKGATEAYSIDATLRNTAYITTVNNYTRNYADVPFEFIVAKGALTAQKDYRVNTGWGDRNQNFMIDPNNILVKFNFVMKQDQQQITLGTIKCDQKTKRFYFSNFSVGSSCAVSRQDSNTMGALNYLNAYNEVQTTLNDLLTSAGATIVNTPVVTTQAPELVFDEYNQPKAVLKTVEVPVDFDLSVENIDKTSIIELLTK